MEPSNHLSQSEIIPILSRATIFTGIGLIEQKMLADKCVIANYRPEEIVIEQGEVGDKLYIIIRGSVQVSVKTQSMGWKRVNTLGAGDVFGEIAILRNIRRTARISTITACQFLTINARDFLAVYQYFPPRARDNIQLVVAKRLQESGAHVRL
ncbi:cyclic nucleotide-binding domain-containing protein [Fluoribacter dumoffii]|uniref:cAMP regulatory protein n=1 Tax=Fluoribacter dumoffii TaxID=463 RepID=A0A377GC21_9GAMM|nr:cyclic nucleotide-binding domain-containing protein [Fluoribacter dumoffii]KTC90675.1 cyclic nucleotide-binding protein [Fluoribacter dumoffii NY 23]MCW8386355.1 cyclic nucleotide-binding domain-containing protein [Fluoribacter dumoffii]MCW8419408.1 cyclic nucleotide-binding domain-containing protein [Fluoribacter dumoffii]MCW8452717.1 cyclic nucleotide-binding domain-containing protein [Fluoribacter dumoffii]MCW8460033.1 cyclic nucleotide-binding domain-containing protein [Fluoribacter dum